MFTAISNWFQSKGGFAHVVAVAIALATAAFAAVPAFHDLVVQLWSFVPSKVQDLAVCAAALYAWYKNTQTKALDAQPASSPIAVKAGVLLLILLPALCLGVTGCSDWERTTFQTLSASKATIDQAAADYNSKAIPQSATNNTLITQARKAQTAAVDAMVAYENYKAQKAAAPQLSAAQQAVVAALADIAPLVVEIKALYTTTPATASNPPPGS